MGVKISAKYIGGKKVEITHETSGTKFVTAAPLDNGGDGSSFSPTDLCTASIGACAMTIIALLAEKLGIDVSSMHMSAEKIMSQDLPRRISEVPVEIYLPSSIDTDSRKKLETAAAGCPVLQSLSTDVTVDIQFIYE